MRTARPREGRLPAPKGRETRARILAAALARFRKKGFDATTMRDVASDAKVALGAAYYYFPSKEAIVMAYYEETQRVCSERAREAFAKTTDPRDRLGAAIHTKLDVLARDRKLLSALFESIADPSADLSVFSPKTRDVREDSIRIFDEAVSSSPEVEALDPASRRVLVLALWSLHMGLMLYFIRDASARAERTRRLADRSLDVVCSLLPLAPQLAPLLGAQIGAILAEAGLLD
jgi:AcrR family transcriptional regulator